MVKKYFLFFLISLFFGCASSFKKQGIEIKNAIQEKRYDDALSKMAKTDLAKDEKSQLLFHLQLGLIYHYKQQYFASVNELQKARKILQTFYDVSISEGLKKSLISETSVEYRGNIQEISLIHFYLSLNHYLIYQQGLYRSYTPYLVKEQKFGPAVKEVQLTPQQRQNHLRSARAEILAWDSFWKTMRVDDKLAKNYKHDLLAKVFGGMIHESMNLRQDDQIAFILYQDAKKIFNKYYKQMDGLKEERIHNKFKDIIDFKILSLAKRIRSWQYKKLLKNIAPSDQVKERLKTIGKNAPNVNFILQVGFVPPLEAEKVNFGFKGLKDSIKNPQTRAIIDRIGIPILASFAATELGLYPKPESWSRSKAITGLALSEVAVRNAGFEFELPIIKSDQSYHSIHYRVLTKKTGKEVAKGNVSLAGPIGSISKDVLNSNSRARYINIGKRLAIKHLIAISTAYVGYQGLGKKDKNKFFAKSVAVGGYMLAATAINKSEKADLRHWDLLPEGIYIDSLSLPAGGYILEYLQRTGEKESVIQRKEFQVPDSKEKTIINQRLFL